MEDNKEEAPMTHYKLLKTEKGKTCYLEINTYILHYSQKLKNGDIIYRFKYYKDTNIKCKAYLKLDKNNKFISKDQEHSCTVDEKKVKNLIIMNDIKESISNKEIIYNIKPKDIFDNSIRKAIKRKKDEEPLENEIKENDNHISIKNEPLPNYTNLKSSIYRNLNKNLLKDIENL